MTKPYETPTPRQQECVACFGQTVVPNTHGREECGACGGTGKRSLEGVHRYCPDEDDRCVKGDDLNCPALWRPR